MLNKFWGVFTQDIAIDLGTANTLVTIRDHGVVINEPSVVAINNQTKQILAVGEEAKQMIGRTPAHVVAIRPLKDGVISDFDSAEAMIRYFVQKVFRTYGGVLQINKPRIVIGVPSLITEVEARAVTDAAKSAGARKVYIIEEPIAAAIGAGLPIETAKGNMIIDIGGGTTDIAVISLGGLVVDNTIKIAGDEFDEAIAEYLKAKYNLEIGLKKAEELKISLGSLVALKDELEAEVGGRDLRTGLPKRLKISSIEVREALQPEVQKIADSALDALEKIPTEILGDVMDRGVFVVGGGAQLRGIGDFLQKQFKVPIHVIGNPQEAVVRGTAELLNDIELLERVQIQDRAFT